MYSQIDGWLDRAFPLPQIFLSSAPIKENNYWLCFLMIEEELPLHLIQGTIWQSVRDSAREARSYVESAIEINGSDQIEDTSDKRHIVEMLGFPPRLALPIYLIVTRFAGLDTIVYIGKTRTGNRFTAGHAVATKLHEQRFGRCEKFVFRCSVTLLWDASCSTDNDRVLIEWMPPAVAEAILDDIESHLIFRLKPEFNIQKKRALLAKNKNVTIHIQHRSNRQSFLHDYITN